MVVFLCECDVSVECRLFLVMVCRLQPHCITNLCDFQCVAGDALLSVWSFSCVSVMCLLNAERGNTENTRRQTIGFRSSDTQLEAEGPQAGSAVETYRVHLQAS